MMQMQEKFVTDEIKRLAPILGKGNAERLTKAYLLGDEKTRLRIMEMIDVVKAAALSDKDMKDALLLEPPEEKEAGNGDIEVGTTMYGRKEMYPLRIKSEKLLTHMGIFGSSGYGKTNLSYSLIFELASKNIPVIIFDFSKMNYRNLLNSKLKDRVDVYTIGKDSAPFDFNPLVPPDGISQTQWAKEFASIFDHAYWLLGGGRHVVLRALNIMYKTNKRPTLNELRENMINFGAANTAREKNWISTAERPMESLCMNELGEMLNVREGKKPSEFFTPGKVTILELDALSDNDKAFFIEIVLQWLRDYLLNQGQRERLQGVVILEEAHHVLNREKTKKMGTETVMDLVFREVRELGLGIVYLDQHPSLVSYPALGNTSMHIYMNLGLDTKQSSDVQDASHMLGFNYEEDGAFLRRLAIGEAIFLNRNSSYPFPFTAHFKKTKTIEHVSDTEVKKHMAARVLQRVPSETVITTEGEIPELDEKELRIVKAIGMGKGVFASQIYRVLRISGSTFREAIKLLVSKGIVDMKPVQLKRTKAHYYFLTDLGERLFKEKFPIITRETIHSEAIKKGFDQAGYETVLDGEVLKISKNGIDQAILLVSNGDRTHIYNIMPNYSNFICATEQISNTVIQEAARFTKNEGKKKTINVATQDMRNGFEEITL